MDGEAPIAAAGLAALVDASWRARQSMAATLDSEALYG
jgi:hypothetical protein